MCACMYVFENKTDEKEEDVLREREREGEIEIENNKRKRNGSVNECSKKWNSLALSLSLSIVISLFLLLFLFLNSSSIVNFIFFATAISSGTNTWFSCRFLLCLFTFNFSFVDFRRRHHTHSYFSGRHFAISLDRSTYHTLHMLHSNVHTHTLTNVHPYTNIHLIRLNAVLFFNLTSNLISSRHNSIVLNNLHFVYCLRTLCYG